MSWVLRSPFHGFLSNGMMLISVIGWKTGRQYTTPVGYYHDGENIWVMTSRNRSWWKNLRDGAKVSLFLKRKSVAAFAKPELDGKLVEEQMVEYLHHVPQAARSLGIRVENGKANMDDVVRIAQDRLFVRIKPLV